MNTLAIMASDDGNREIPTIVDLILDAIPAHVRALVAIDGVGASGKSVFADRIAQLISDRPTIILHVDDFFNPAAIRHARGRYSPGGFWLDSYDYPALTATALTPLLASGSGTYRSHSYDRDTDELAHPSQHQAPDDAVVLVEGTFLHRNELVHFWDYSIYLDVSFCEARRRMATRDSLRGPDNDLVKRYEDAQLIYFAEANPKERARLLVDNTDFENPVILRPRQE